MLEQISNDLRTNIERMAVIGGAATLSRRLRDGVFFIILYRPLRIRCRLARKPDIFDTLQISPLGPPRRLRYSQLVAQVTLEIPDDLLAALETPGQELSRSIFEAAVLGSLSGAQAFDGSSSAAAGLRDGLRTGRLPKDPPSLVGIQL